VTGRRPQPHGQQPYLRLVEARAECRHRAAPPSGNRGDDRRAVAAVVPRRVVERRRAQHGIAGAVRAVAGAAVLQEQGAAFRDRRIAAVAARNGEHVVGEFLDARRADDAFPRGHRCLAARPDRFGDARLVAAPLPGGIAQVGEHVCLPARVATVAGSALAREHVRGGCHRVAVRGERV